MNAGGEKRFRAIEKIQIQKSKIQINFQTPNSKLQDFQAVAASGGVSAIWASLNRKKDTDKILIEGRCLELIWSFGFGFWNFR